jgi:hypothetical protein
MPPKMISAWMDHMAPRYARQVRLCPRMEGGIDLKAASLIVESLARPPFESSAHNGVGPTTTGSCNSCTVHASHCSKASQAAAERITVQYE